MPTSIIQRRVGTEEKEPKRISLAAGKLAADFVVGSLRTIRYEDREVLRGISYVVRDQDWGTYDPEIGDCTIRQEDDGFRVAFRGRCSGNGQILEYQAKITGNANGQVVFEVAAEPQTSFLTSRCGFTVLHPLDGVVGQPVVVEHVDGTEEHATFPELITPSQPFKEIRAIRHQVAPGVTVCCRMNGDVFEMEDQRAWSDASFKTYGRPLSLPCPFVMEEGARNQQSVELEITRDCAATDRLSLSPSRQEAGRPVGDTHITVEIGESDGIFPQIGIAVHPDQLPAALANPELLKTLRPQTLLLHFDPSAGHGREDLGGFREIALRLGSTRCRAECCLELVLPVRRNPGEELREIAAMIAEAGMKLSAVLVSPAPDRQSTLPGGAWPSCPPLAEIYKAARETFPGLAIGGGMLSYFAELNRKRPPVDLLDFVSHCTCPIVHAADDMSVMQSLEAMPYIVRSARAIIGADKLYRIGPSTIGMRHNPYGSRVMANPGNRRVTMTDRDPRQPSLFAAAWMIGYAAATAEARLQTLTVGALTGPLGLASTGAPGEPVRHPVFHTARGLAELAGRPRYQCHSSQPNAIAVVAGEDSEGKCVAWIANLTGQNQTIALSGVTGIESMHLLDETNFMEPVAIARRAGLVQQVNLQPYAVARLEPVMDL